MRAPTLNQVDRMVIESVPGMGCGYLLYFSNHAFSEIFRDFGVKIDDEDLVRAHQNRKEPTA